MEFHVITLFPAMLSALDAGLIGKAREHRIIAIHGHDLREHGLGNYRQVDDTPYGGGSGMVMRPEPIASAIEAVEAIHPGLLKLLMTPAGETFTQSIAREFAEHRRGLMLIAGRYEGIDDRVGSMIDREISIGDYVLSGGELAAMVVIETVARLIPGVVGNPDSLAEESFSDADRLEYPQYTRPEEFRGFLVPEILLSGDHGKIRSWREEESRKRTARRSVQRAGRRER
jgi:tRNA (guanine37-N1)-methyltransferase